MLSVSKYESKRHTKCIHFCFFSGSSTWDMAPSMDRSKHQDCGVMYQGGTIDDVSCDKRAHYVCEMSAFQGHLNLGCGSWLRGGQSCYFLGQGHGYSWSEAKDQCARAGAQLLQIDNLDEKVIFPDVSLSLVTNLTFIPPVSSIIPM